MKPMKIIIATAITTMIVNAEQTSENTQIQIYNNYAQIIEQNKVKGVGKDLVIKKYDIPSKIIDDSIYIKGEDIDIKEVSYNKNKIEFKTLLKERLMGKIRFFKREENGGQKAIIQGTLMSINPIIIKDEGDKLYTFVDEKDIIIEEIPAHYYAKENIEIRYNAKKPDSKYELNYLTRGLSCAPIYNIKIEEGYAQLKGYMLIENSTEKSFDNVTVRCISGDIKEPSGKVRVPGIMPAIYSKTMSKDSVSKNAQYNKIKNYEFQIYELPYKTTISQNSKKLNVFVNIDKVKTKEENKLVLTQSIYTRPQEQKRFERYLVIKNEKENGLGINFQEGSVRVYKKINKFNIYNGGSHVEFTPKNEDLEILLGSNNSLILDETIKLSSTKKRTESLKYENITYNESVIGKEFKITNNGEENQNFTLELEAMPNANMEILSMTCNSDVDKCLSKEEFNKIKLKGNIKKEAIIKIKYKLITGKSTRVKS